MRHCRRLSVIFIAIVLMFSLSIPTSADMSNFLDRTMDQLKGINVKAYQGQERGYLMGGSASIRFDQYEQPLVSVTPPSLKVGCSGIDIVMGGFSYLNFEYLVQKFQSILSAAPAFAFQVALKTLCESCADTVQALDNLVNQINGLNVNSCQAAKALGTWGGQQLGYAVGNSLNTGGVNAWFKGLSQDIQDFGNSYKSYITSYAGAYDCYTLSDPNARQACMKKQGKVSFLTPLMTQAFNDMTYDFPFESIFRAYFGDIYEDPNAGPDTPTRIIGDPGCFPDRSFNLAEAIVEGAFTQKIHNTSEYVNASCTQIDLTAQQKGLRDQVEADLTAIIASVRSNTPLTLSQINLINASSIPIYRLFSLAILVERLGGDTSNILTAGMVKSIADPLAYDISSQVLHRLYGIANAKLHAAAVSKDMPEAVTLIKPIVDRINSAALDADRIASEKMQAFYKNFGDAVQKEAMFQTYIYKALAKNKLLDSYLFAKGLR